MIKRVELRAGETILAAVPEWMAHKNGWQAEMIGTIEHVSPVAVKLIVDGQIRWLPLSVLIARPVDSDQVLALPVETHAAPVEQVAIVHEPRANLVPLNVRFPDGMRLYPYQQEGARFALTVKRGLIGDVMGLGKSMQAIAVMIRAHYLLRDQFPGVKVIPSLVVTTASMKAHWRAELERWWPGARVQLLEGKQDKPAKNQDVYLVNYDLLSGGWIEDPHTGQKLEQVKLSPVGAALRTMPKAVMVLDESQAIKTPTAQRTLATIELGRNAQYKLLLTGTAILNRPVELIPQLEFLGYLDPVFDGAEGFRRRYCSPRLRKIGRRRVWDYSGSSNVPELHQKLEAFTIRRRKADVALQLPPKRFARITVELANRAEYDRLEAAVEMAPPEVRVGMLAQIRRACGIGKLTAAREWIEGFLEADPDEKLVVFAHHREIQDALLRVFPDAARVFGADSSQKRQEAVRRFQEDPSCRLIICSLMAGKEGITLTAAANMLVVEFDWVPGNLEQAHDRIHRIGQTADLVTIWTLAAEDSIDGKLDELLREKRVVTGGVLDGRAGVITESNVKMHTLADLLRRVKARSRKVAT